MDDLLELNMDELIIESIDNFKFKKVKVLETGAFGKVFLCIDENTKTKLAMKCIEVGNTDNNDKAKKEMEKFKYEISLFQTLSHERIVEYFASACTSTTISILMEYMEGGSLRNKILSDGALNEKTASEKSYQILSGLIYLHSKLIIHRDIKGANILLDIHGNCKIADFGISKQIQTIRSQAGCKTFTGSIYWMSPEVIKASPNVEYGQKTDIWSFGCTVLEMLTTKPPWFDLEPISAIYRIASQPTIPHLPEVSSNFCKNFVNDCFISDPALRPNASQLLSYDWIRVYRE